MIDLKDLRDNPDKYRRGAQLKGVSVDVDAILAVDERRRQHLQAFERARAEQNQASTQIGKLRDPAEKQAAIARVSTLKETVKAEDERAKAAETELAPLLLRVPQPPDDDVPVGADATPERRRPHVGRTAAVRLQAAQPRRARRAARPVRLPPRGDDCRHPQLLP